MALEGSQQRGDPIRRVTVPVERWPVGRKRLRCGNGRRETARIVVDDYYSWSGCQQAVDDYFRDRTEFRLLERAKLHVVRA